MPKKKQQVISKKKEEKVISKKKAPARNLQVGVKFEVTEELHSNLMDLRSKSENLPASKGPLLDFLQVHVCEFYGSYGLRRVDLGVELGFVSRKELFGFLLCC